MISLNFTGPGAPFSLLGDRPTKGYTVPADPDPEWRNYGLIQTVPKPEGHVDTSPRKACRCGRLARRGYSVCSSCRVGDPSPLVNKARSRAARIRWANARRRKAGLRQAAAERRKRAA